MPIKLTNQTNGFLHNRKPGIFVSLIYWGSRWRSGLLRLIERILIGANISDRLGGDLSQIRHLPEVADQILEYKLISDAEFASPLIVGSNSILEASSPRKMGILKNCLVDLPSGLIRLDTGFIVDSALPHWQQLLYQGGMTHEYKRIEKSQNVIAGTCLVIPPAKYFYHFILEDLATIGWIRKEIPGIRILLHQNAPHWQRSVLEDLEIGFTITSENHARIENLAFVTSPRILTQTEVKKIQSLGPDLEKTPEKRRLILIRGEKERGDVSLENSLTRHFTKFGYEVLDPDTISFRDQRRLFSEAERVVALHGGALANLVWCKGGTKVLEIFNHPFRTHDYAKICAQNNLTYFSINLDGSYFQDKYDLKSFNSIPEEFTN